jgi:hypothetical protein
MTIVSLEWTLDEYRIVTLCHLFALFPECWIIGATAPPRIQRFFTIKKRFLQSLVYDIVGLAHPVHGGESSGELWRKFVHNQLEFGRTNKKKGRNQMPEIQGNLPVTTGI